MTNIELINLTLDQIRRCAQVVSDVSWDAKVHDAYKKDKNDPLFAKIAKDGEDELNEIRIKLRDVYEEIAEYQNIHECLDNAFVAIGEVATDFIYERKKDEDYD